MSTTAAATATISPWVPVFAAAIGAGAALIVGVLTQLWSSRRENQRWLREREERQEQWRREDSLRWDQERQQAYAGLMAALDEWDDVLEASAMVLDIDTRTQVRTDIEVEDLTRLGEIAGKASALVELMAPKAVASLAQAAIKDRHAFRITFLELLVAQARAPDRSSVLSRLEPQLTKLRNETSRLRDAIRDDLGIESKQGDAASAGDTKGT